MKVRDCLALIQDENLWIESPDKVRAFQAIINANKLHLLSDKDKRMMEKLMKWGHLTPQGLSASSDRRGLA
jgi:hypothetical protein